VVPVKVKYKQSHKLKIERSLRSFIAQYKPGAAFIVNLDFEDSFQLDQTKVFFIPFWRLHSMDLTAEVPDI
jgi:hypothetical protein